MALRINGQDFNVPLGAANAPLATFIKTRTPFKSVKVACGEGGCGACTVAIEEELDGRPHLRTINACLAPVYSVLGRSLRTAEGLLKGTANGTSIVAERLSDFHASQCGFCTPGFTVACHAALHNAATAAAASGTCAGQAAVCNGVALGNGSGSNSGSDGGNSPLIAEGALLRELDGNLCRCTGYRPIVAACRSLTHAEAVADMEDLGRCSSKGSTHVRHPEAGKGTLAPTTAASAAIASAMYDGSVEASYVDSLTVAEVAVGPGQILKVPRSMEQLVAEAGRLAAMDVSAVPTYRRDCPAPGDSDLPPPSRRCSWRLVAGHTGPGVFKDWPLEQKVLLSVTEVPELQRLELVMAAPGNGDVIVNRNEGVAAGSAGAASDIASTHHLHIGACTTLERLAARLTRIATASAAETTADGSCGVKANSGGQKVDRDGDAVATFGVRQWAAETAAHLYRIAGRHVRNSATVGGNLVLARERCLPSDVATLLAAVGAEVELVVVSADAAIHRSVVSADLLQFVNGIAPALPVNASYILTAVRVPLPPADPRVRFWSHRIAERYSNAPAVANAAVLVRLSSAPKPPPALQVGFSTTADLSSSGTEGGLEAGDEPPRVEDVRIVVGVRSPSAGCTAGPGGNYTSSGSGINEASSSRSFLVEHNAAKLVDTTAVLLDGWRLLRVEAAEAALRRQPVSAAAVAEALEAVSASGLLARLVDEVGDDGDGSRERGERSTAAAAIAQGLMAQGLMACLGLSPPKQMTGAAVSSDQTTDADTDTNGYVGGLNANGNINGCNNTNDATHVNRPAHTLSSEPQALPAPAPLRMPPPDLVNGYQVLPESVPELHPVTQPVPKLGSKLQASGTAHYTEDVPVHDGALYGAFVLASRAGMRLAGIDASPALALHGAVRFLGAADLPMVGPAGALNTCDLKARSAVEPTFLEVGSRCEFAGQVVGVVLADSPWTAQRAAKAVQLMYDTGTSDELNTGPLLSITDAVHAKSFYPLSATFPFAPSGTTYGANNSYLSKGGDDVDEVLAAAAAQPAAALALAAFGGVQDNGAAAAAGMSSGHNGNGSAVAATDGAAVKAQSAPGRLRVVTGRYLTPSQLHFYMESQSAVAWPDEDGCVVLYSSCQGPDMVQSGVATALRLPHNKVLVRCRRVGGGFGGKVTFARRVAVVTAIAAVATGRQVRISVPRNTDFAMCGGRCESDVSYTAVLDEATEPSDVSGNGSNRPTSQQQQQQQSPSLPRLRALDLHVVMRGGAYLDISFIDTIGLLMSVDSVYDIPAFRVEVAMVRCNLPPRTAVRGPGEITGTMIIEQVMEHVAAELGLDPEAFRLANFLKPPPAAATAATTDTSASGGTAPEVAPDSSPGSDGAVRPPQPPPPAAVKTALGRKISSRLYTLPYMWERLQREAGWEQIKAEVESFNAANALRKRGVAMIPTRYSMMRGSKPAYVSVLQDGTVLVACHGVEMGQGLWTKVVQVAAATLSEVLPPARRPLDMTLIRIADNSTELLPHSGITSSSTSSELACAAVRLACLNLVNTLRTHALPNMAGRDDFEFKDLIASLAGPRGLLAPLSAYAWGGQAELPESSSLDAPGPLEPMYHVLGVALAVAEVDVLTGDRRVLRADVMFDLGRPTNPAVDLGQVEGAFVQGLGMMLQEEVSYDRTTGALVQNSTWNYKPPSVSCAPQQLNVYMLNDAPLASGGPVSSKACGEPPLLLSFAALAALQRATAAARSATTAAAAASAPIDTRNALIDGSGGSSESPVPGLTEGLSVNGRASFGVSGNSGVRRDSVVGAGFTPLLAPATVERVRLACGNWSAAQLLRLQAGL